MEQSPIIFSSGAIAAVAGLLGGMSLAIVALFGLLAKVWVDQRADWKDERADLRARVDRLTAILEGQAETLKRRKP